MPLVAHADFAFLFKLGVAEVDAAEGGKPGVGLGGENGRAEGVLRVLREAVSRYERTELAAEE